MADSSDKNNKNNLGANQKINHRAAVGKFQVVAVDTFDDTEWVEGDFDNLAEAKKIADELGGPLVKTYVYNDRGDRVYDAGMYKLD